MEIPKRRGRPKGSKKSKSVQYEDDEYASICRELNKFMDSQQRWIFTTFREDHTRRSAIEDAVSRGEINEDAWSEEQALLASLWERIRAFRKEERETKQEEIEDAEQFTEEEESIAEKLAANDAVHVTRKSYLKWKPPLQRFNEEGLEALPEEKCEILQQHANEIFADGVTYQEQLSMVISLIYDSSRKSKSGCQNIGKLFGVTRGAIQTHITRLANPNISDVIGRPSLLSVDDLVLITEYINKKMIGGKSPDFPTLRDWIYRKFDIDITTNTLSKIIERTPTLKICQGIPMEEVRAEVELETLVDYYDRLSQFLESLNIPPEFTFNVDESGFQSFVDAVSVPVIVSAEYDDDEIAISTNRNSKRASMIGCIAADGSALKPLIVISRKRIQETIKRYGYTDETCLIVHQESGFVSAAIFDYWASNILFPEITRRRALYGYEGDVLLFLDGCTSHFSDFFLDECTYFNVIPWKEPPGTSDQIQALDLGIFGIQKALKRSIKPPQRLKDDEKEVIAIVDSWRRATTPANVTSAFRQAGLYQEQHENGYVMRADIKYARAVRGMAHEEAPIPVDEVKTTPILSF